MLKTVVTGLLILIVAVFGFVGYSSYSAKRNTITDDVYNSGVPVSATTSPATRESPVLTSGAPGGRQIPSAGEAVSHGDGAPLPDTLPSQPPEGGKFGAGGKYQLYRQGDITWRLNVDTGESCILLATDEEWHKERVYRSGCGGRR